MIKVLATVVYDILHYGHIIYLEQGKSLGNYLLVAVDSDKHIASRNKSAITDEENRKIVIGALKCVDETTILKNYEDIKTIIERENIDIVVFSEEYTNKFDYLSEYAVVKYLPYTKEISSTKIKEK